MSETKQFRDIPVDQVFTLNGVQYKKINEERVSCCKALNAITTDGTAQKIQVLPLDNVIPENKPN